MITSVIVRCIKCKRDATYTTYDKVHPRKLAVADGWRDTHKGWICKQCRKGGDDESQDQ